MSDQRPLRDWVTPEVDEREVRRMWGAVSASIQRRGPNRWLIGAVVFSTSLAVALLALLLWPQPSGSDTLHVTRFNDGSTAELDSMTTLTLATETEQTIRVKLSSGRVTFEVSKRPSRKFIVDAADVTITVIGTRFTVEANSGAVSVGVQRGLVEIAQREERVRITAGQTWHSTAAASVVVPEATDEPELKLESVTAVKEKTPPPRRVMKPVGTASVEPDLFQLALAARREGRPAEAAIGLERFLRETESDERAPVAAFELGRLRMDALRDTAGAVEALTLSLRKPNTAFREEALNRLVRGLERLGRLRECEEAKASYMREFPQGAYAQSVGAACAAHVAE